jgi:hypothetical protein
LFGIQTQNQGLKILVPLDSFIQVMHFTDKSLFITGKAFSLKPPNVQIFLLQLVSIGALP